MKNLLLALFLSLSLFAAPPKFLMPEEAFKPHAKLNTSGNIIANVELGKGIYLYEAQTKVELKNAAGVVVERTEKPEAVDHDGDRVYTSTPKFTLFLQKESGVSGIVKGEVVVSYQGCSEQGLCYEPDSKSFAIDIDTSKLPETKAEPKALDVATLSSADAPTSKANADLSETDAIANTILSGNLAIIILTFMGFGLLLSLTPCVFPMVPIISGVIISQGRGITTKRALFLSLVYVLSMAVAYTIAGVMAGLFGANLQAALQNPVAIFIFSGIFVALALSMFGFYELKLPDSLVAKVSSSSNHSGVAGVAIMGFLSALIVGPCVAAPLAGALVYIGQTGDAVLGGIALFAMSIGMGIPLIAVGVSAGKFMPRPGAWMTMVTDIFGVMMLAVAIWMLERVVSDYITMVLYSVLGIGFALYLGAHEKEVHIFKKSMAVVMLIYSISLFIGALGGSTSMLKPLEFLKPTVAIAGVNQQGSTLQFVKVHTIEELDMAMANAKGKKVMVDFYATWCTSCKELEAITFKDPKVINALSEFVLIKADISANGVEQKALSKKYGVFGPPVLLFFDASHTLQSPKTVVGYIEPQKFLEHLAAL
ncbi:MAG: protein-disulfide reductase DsbD [Epsilonproteobacteria bacterium]|nr:protein-disulfide reductase DsbD [Campylobacterota bacterium]